MGLSWRNCGPATDSIQLKSLQISPDPIQVPGKSIPFNRIDNLQYLSIGTLSITGSADVTSQIPTDVHVCLLFDYSTRTTILLLR